MIRWIVGAISALALIALASPGYAASGKTGIAPSQMYGCNQAAIYDASTSGMTKMVTHLANQQIYVCGYVFFSNGSASVGLVYGTGGTCGVGTISVTPAFELGAQTGIVDHLPVYTGLLPVPTADDLCINVSGAVAVQAVVYYTQF